MKQTFFSLVLLSIMTILRCSAKRHLGESSLNKLYPITNTCIICLRNLGIFSETDLKIIKNSGSMSVKMLEKLARNNTGEPMMRLLTQSYTSQITYCVNGDFNEEIEKQINQGLIQKETECSDRIASYFNNRNNWRKELCIVKESNYCLPTPMTPTQSTYIFALCLDLNS